MKALKTLQQSKVRMKALKSKVTLVMIWFLTMTILAKLTRQYLEDIVGGVDVDVTLMMKTPMKTKSSNTATQSKVQYWKELLVKVEIDTLCETVRWFMRTTLRLTKPQ